MNVSAEISLSVNLTFCKQSLSDVNHLPLKFASLNQERSTATEPEQQDTDYSEK